MISPSHSSASSKSPGEESPRQRVVVTEPQAELPLVQVEHVNKSFGSVRVIEDVSLSIYPGKVQALLGENGAGKSTVITMIAGVY